jgi:cold shock CspA family protein
VTDARSGVVASFDADEGLGTLALDDGTTVPFHATQLADGTRRVEVGARVTASIVPWHLGRLEATEIEVVGTATSPDC